MVKKGQAGRKNAKGVAHAAAIKAHRETATTAQEAIDGLVESLNDIADKLMDIARNLRLNQSTPRIRSRDDVERALETLNDFVANNTSSTID